MKNLLFPLAKSAVSLFVLFLSRSPSVKRKLIEPNAQKTINLYQDNSFASLFAQVRFWDAPLKELEEKVPISGTILDLGCGEGILTNYLALSSKKRKLIGIEITINRSLLASKGLPNATFIQDNVLTAKLPKSDAIVLSHMMHHLPSYKSQQELLTRCYHSLKPGGKLVIAEVDKQRGFHYFVSWFTDVVLVPILFEGRFTNTQVFHRSSWEWLNVLSDIGFQVKHMEGFTGRPFLDLIIEAQKP